MAALYPGALPAAGTAVSTDTLAAAGHTSLHNTVNDEARAIAAKIGTGSSTPAANQVLRGTGVGTSAWGQVALATEVSGILPVASGGTGESTQTGTGLPVAQTSPTINSPTLTTPTIASFVNAGHNHQNAAGGGTLAAAALDAGAVTPEKLQSGTGTSWAWQNWTPTLTNLTLGNGTLIARYIQIGKTVFLYFKFTLGSTSAVGTNPIFSLPVTAVASVYSAESSSIGAAKFTDSGTGYVMGDVSFNSTTEALFQYLNSAGTALASNSITATVPFTWATNDVISTFGFYEVA